MGVKKLVSKNIHCRSLIRTTTTSTTTTTTTTTTTSTTISAIPTGVQQNIHMSALSELGFQKYVEVGFSEGNVKSKLLNVPVTNVPIFIGCYNRKEVRVAFF